jgi:hypothetical protein
MNKYLKLTLVFASFLTLFAFSYGSPAYSCVDSGKACTANTDNPLLHCRECTAKKSDGTYFKAQRCRKKTDTTPTDTQLEKDALDDAIKRCEKSSSPALSMPEVSFPSDDFPADEEGIFIK